MKKIIEHIVLTIFVANIALLASCSGFEEMNEDPNRISYGYAPPTKLLMSIIYNGHWTVYYRSYWVNNNLMQYAVYWASSNDVSNYNLSASDMLAPWRDLYRWSSSANHMYKVAIEYDDPNCMAIALTLKVYMMEVVTSLYGDVPYSEAMQWDEVPERPKYDLQSDIYKMMLDELDQANKLYVLTRNLDYPARDLLYNGDIAKWQKFTNSLRLRLLMRVSKCTEINAPAMMQEMINNPATYPIFTSNTDAAILRYTGETPFYNQFGTMGGYDVMGTNSRLGKTLLDLMNLPEDPRRAFYATARNGIYEGMASGQDGDYTAAILDIACNYNGNLSTNTSPSTLMNYAELLFIKAEAAFRGFITGDVESYYNEGVAASVREWTGSEAYDVTPFLSHESVSYNNTLLRIMEQKYISQFLCGFESWCDYRRTGLPEMPIGPIMANRNENGVPTMPTRVIYPLITQSANGENYKAAVERMGGKDDMLTKLWFANGTRY